MAAIEPDSAAAGSPAGGASAAPRPAALLTHFQAVRALTLRLAEPLNPEDQVVQSMPDASPTKWHLAHTTWFFETLVLRHAERHHRCHDERFAYLFNSYYNTLGPMHARGSRGLLSRPTVAEVQAYRAAVDERMARLFGTGGLPEALSPVLLLGIHHEQQHQELLLTDIKHLFSLSPLKPAYARASPGGMDGYPLPPGPSREGDRPPAEALPLAWHTFEGGLTPVGHAGPGFCFDNEQPRHLVHLAPFRLASRPVTNGEWLEFVRDGGYARPDFWLAEGWDLVRREGWQRPLYWAATLDHEHSLRGERELDLAAPACHLSYYEADAFARWAGARLPTEAEWEAAAGEALPAQANFLDSGRLHPHPGLLGSWAVREAATRAGALLRQMLGDVWEWTASAYSPYPGYRPAPGAPGEYNGKFMVNQMVLRGGSCLTPCGHIRASYRNFFPPAARWQMSGVRLARD